MKRRRPVDTKLSKRTISTGADSLVMTEEKYQTSFWRKAAYLKSFLIRVMNTFFLSYARINIFCRLIHFMLRIFPMNSMNIFVTAVAIFIWVQFQSITNINKDSILNKICSLQARSTDKAGESLNVDRTLSIRSDYEYIRLISYSVERCKNVSRR